MRIATTRHKTLYQPPAINIAQYAEDILCLKGLGLLVHDVETEAVKGSDRDVFQDILVCDTEIQSLLHLLCGLVGKCNGQHLVRPRNPVRKKPGNPFGNGARFPCPGTGHYQERSAGMKHSLFLQWVKVEHTRSRDTGIFVFWDRRRRRMFTGLCGP